MTYKLYFFVYLNRYHKRGVNKHIMNRFLKNQNCPANMIPLLKMPEYAPMKSFHP